jgi:ketosteroid isomerase-like protein
MPAPPSALSRQAGLSLEDRDAIRDLRARFSDSANLRQFDVFAALFAADGVWEVPDMQAAFHGRSAVRTGIEAMLEQWSLFVQMPHDGPIDVAEAAADGAVIRASGRTYVHEMGILRAGGSQRNDSIYEDAYAREDGAWRFARRTYHFLYVDESALAGHGVPLPRELAAARAGDALARLGATGTARGEHR